MTDLTVNPLVSIASHGAAVVAFGAFALVLLLGGNRQGTALHLMLACVMTAVWAAAVAGAAALLEEMRTPVELVTEMLRSIAWIAFLQRLLSDNAASHGARIPATVTYAAGAFLVSVVAIELCLPLLDSPLAIAYTLVGRLATSIIGLTIIENLARNDWHRAQWWARFLFIGLGGIFVFDLFLYSEALLFRRVNLELYAVRGAVDLIAVPLMAISFSRNPTFDVNIHVSRRFVFHTMTLAGTGVYLLLMAVGGYYLRSFGGTWGTLLSVTFLSAALVLIVLTLSSGTFRSAVRSFVSQNFFSYKYDYRQEWQQFIQLISAQESLLPLHERVVQALANIIDSPAGSLWVIRDGAYVNTAVWNAPLSPTTQPTDNRLAEALEAHGQVIELAAPAPALQGRVPDWLQGIPRSWIAIPLIHRHHLIGLLVLTLPRVSHRLDEEDHALLITAASQAASYIAEEETTRALLDARQLEMFNQRFAFVVHDIKNLTSQLSLILSNVERHGDNPEFQRDVIATVRHSVASMTGMLEQISVARRTAPAATSFDLVALIRQDWESARRHEPRVQLLLPDRPSMVHAEPKSVSQVLRHVVQNALDAVGGSGKVEISLSAQDGMALVKIVDDGPGMTPEFIRDVLFRPFGTTKKSGYGIGAYQARELIRRMGGRLDVTSTVDVGTEVNISLPIAAVSVATAPQVQEA